MRRIAAVLTMLVGLAAAPAALGDGGMQYASQLGAGVLSPDGTTRYVAVGGVVGTTLERISALDGTVQLGLELGGAWGTPVVTNAQDGAGISTDGRTLVLADIPAVFPRTESSFMIFNTKTMRRHVVVLRGDYAYDALSPSGSRLYVIDHVSAVDQTRYVVRAVDVATGTLLPGRIADRTQKSWVMAGFPISRATSADGRWVYTLYDNPGGFPFVHALDTVHGIAHCIGLPWRGGENAVYNMRLSLRGDGTLAVHWLSGRRWLTVNTGTWRLASDTKAFPWWMVAAAALGALLLAGLVRSRRRAPGVRLAHA